MKEIFSDKELLNKVINEFYRLFMKEKVKSKDKINKIKNYLAKKYKLKKQLNNHIILSFLDEEKREKIRPYLILKPSRTLSGVSVIAIMIKPFPCPHGRCIFCPGGKDSLFGNVPNSYTGLEPSTMRAIRNEFNPYLIVWNRLYQYVITGHKPTKIEGIIQGGTFFYTPFSYKYYVIFSLYKALNDFSSIFYTKNSINYKKFFSFFPIEKEEGNFKRVNEKIKQLQKFFLGKEIDLSRITEEMIEKVKEINEKESLVKLVALTLETKPDFAKKEQINEALFYGATRIELGIQTTIDRVLEINKRSHNVEDNIESTGLLKDSAYKITYHIMPGLYGQTREEDLMVFRELFENEFYKPDSLKIYPTLVTKGTSLYELWKKGKYNPYTDEEIVNLLVKALKYIPPYVRIMRFNRDIPTTVVDAGVKKSNLREVVYRKAEEEGIKIKEIRYREIGRKTPEKNKLDEWEIKILKYNASYGKEFFISAELPEDDILLGFVRLRIPGKNKNFIFRPEITEKTALIRELHVYGSEVPLIDKKGVFITAQNKGIGKALMKKAEEVAIKEKMEKIVVISGVGVRNYYYKLGYKKEGPYVSKII